MRRARLKVTATVPIRRRLARENAPAQPITSRDDKLNDIPPIIPQSSPSRDISSIVCDNVQVSDASVSESKDDSRRISTPSSMNLEGSHVVERNGNHNFITHSSRSTKITPFKSAHLETAVQNEIQNSPTNGSLNLSKAVVKTKRKMMVSESARKLAEARREFQLKHENKPPDRSQLRMYDFIHYNPSTNPMRKKCSDINSTKTTISTPIESPLDVLGEEDIDDPTSNAIPVPQVKVGPDGQLVIDEQSLVIEHTGVKESRAALANRAVIIDDNDYGNGFYKRRKKTKEWPEWETIKFYKALNTVGTDFLLMQSLFPKRSRQELKTKFKKEERMNRLLVEKALKYSQEFDFDLLKKELESFENPEKVAPKSPVKQNQLKNVPKQSRKRKQASRRIAAMSICEEDADEGIIHNNSDEPSIEASPVSAQVTSKSKRITAFKSKSCNEAGNVSESEEYEVRPTRSGRRPKLKKIRTYTKHSLDKMPQDDNSQDTYNSKHSKISDKDQIISTREISTDRSVFTLESDGNSVENTSSVEPGSLVIVSKESIDKPGETVVQVYMVSSDADGKINLRKTIAPVDIDPDSLLKVSNEANTNATSKLLQDLTDA